MSIPTFSILLLLLSLVFIETGKRRQNKVITKIGSTMAITAILIYIIIYLGIMK